MPDIDERSPDTNLDISLQDAGSKEKIEGGKRMEMGKSKKPPIVLDLIAFVLNTCPASPK